MRRGEEERERRERGKQSYHVLMFLPAYCMANLMGFLGITLFY